jgi:hypothetical protein
MTYGFFNGVDSRIVSTDSRVASGVWFGGSVLVFPRDGPPFYPHLHRHA